MRKCLAVIFIIVFSFQVLPLKVLGKLLAKGQTEEEVKNSDGADDTDTDTDGKIAKYNDFACHGGLACAMINDNEKRKGFAVHQSDDLPKSHVGEIASPPPNL